MVMPAVPNLGPPPQTDRIQDINTWLYQAYTIINNVIAASGLENPVLITQGGTGATTQASGFDNLSPLTTQGDVLYHNGTDNVRLAKNSSSTRYLSNTGTSNNPAWAQVNLSNGVTGLLPISNLTTTGVSLQTRQSVKTDTQTLTSTTFTDITGLDRTIQPQSLSSSVLVCASLCVGAASGAAGYIRLVRDSTTIGVGDAAGSRAQVSNGFCDFSSGSVLFPTVVMFLDTPSSTSTLTYKVQFRGVSASAVYINRSGTDTDTSAFGRGISSLTVMEIG